MKVIAAFLNYYTFNPYAFAIRTYKGNPIHSELFIEGKSYSVDYYNAITRIADVKITKEKVYIYSDGFVQEYDRNNWILKEFDIEDSLVAEVIESFKEGITYDVTGIVFSQVFPFGFHNPKKEFCSKLNAKQWQVMKKLDLQTKPQMYDPKSLFMALN